MKVGGKKKRISSAEAFERFVDGDFEVMKDEMDGISQQASELGKEQTRKFFYWVDKDVILLEIYWDGELVHRVTFG